MVLNSFSIALARSQNLMDAPSTAPRRSMQPDSLDLGQLQRTVDRQHLLLQTLLMLLLEKKVIEEQEFKQWMNYVDGLDGKRDGKIEGEKTPIACPGCRRINARNSTKCQYCGEEFEVEFLTRRKPE